MRSGRKTGQKPKDSEITDNFNTEKKDALKALQKRQATIQAELDRRERERLEKEKLAASAEADDGDSEEGDDKKESIKSAYQMLKDLRWVYNHRDVKGRKRLLELAKDDKQFTSLVKELIKVETALLAQDLKAKQDFGGQNVATFVVIRGLEDVRKLPAEAQGDVDIQRILDAVDPTKEKQIEQEAVLEGPAPP